MQFKSLSKGYNVYLLNKDKVSVDTCPVMDITAPHYDPNYQTGQNPLNMIKVCDVTLNIGGNPTKYVIGEDEEVAYGGQNLIITPNKDCVFRELEAMKNTSEEAINQIDYHKERIEKCSSLMSDFSVEYKGKKEIEDRLSKVEQGLGRIENIEAMLKKLTKSKEE